MATRNQSQATMDAVRRSTDQARATQNVVRGQVMERSVQPGVQAATLADVLKSPTQGGANPSAATITGSDPESRARAQLAQEAVYTRLGRPDLAQQSSQRYIAAQPKPVATTPAPMPTVNLPAVAQVPQRQTLELRYPQQQPQMIPVGQQVTPQQQQIARGPSSQNPSSFEDLISIIQSRYGQSNPNVKSEDQLRQEAMSEAQRAIDAINARYATLIDGERDKGTERLGRARAMAVGAGTVYSPRGEAAQNQVEDLNSENLRALEAERGQEIANVYAAMNNGLQSRIQYNSGLATQQANDYIDNLYKVYSMRQAQQEAEDTARARWAALMGYGQNGAPTLETQRYLSDLQNQQFSQDLQNRQFGLSQQELDAKMAEMAKKNYQFMQLDNGAFVAVDPETGTMQNLGMYAAPRSSSGSGSRYGIGADGLSSVTPALSAWLGAGGTMPSAQWQTDYIGDIYNQGMQRYYSDPNSYALPDGQYGPALPDQNYNPFGESGLNIKNNRQSSYFGFGSSSMPSINE